MSRFSLFAALFVVAPMGCDNANSTESDTGADATGTTGGSSGTVALTSGVPDPGTSTGTSSSTAPDDPSIGVATDTSSSSSDGTSESSSGGEGMVAMQVLSMHGGRFSRSCDGGETWSEMWEQNADADCFHDPDSLYPRPAYGNGAFVVPSGWGDPGAMYVSVDGASWERSPSLDLLGGGTSEVTGAGVFFDGSEFGVFRRLRSENGFDWFEQRDDQRPPGVGNVRRVAFSVEDDLLVVIGNDDYVYVSQDWSQTWSDPTSAVGVCQSSQHRGDIAIREGQIVIAGDLFCVSNDAGATWTNTWTPPSSAADVFTTPSGYVALHSDESVSSSIDGVDWNTIGQIPTEANMTAGAWSGAGEGLVVYVANNNGDPAQVYTSADGGKDWSATATLPGSGCPRINLETFVVPQELCQ